MGVCTLFEWLNFQWFSFFPGESRRTPEYQSTFAYETNGNHHAEYLYIDMFFLMHVIFSQVNLNVLQEKKLDRYLFYNEFISKIMNRIEEELKMIRPELLFLSYDGVPVVAKFVPQMNGCSGRFNQLLKVFKKDGISKELVWTHEIMPGSEFTDYICKQIYEKIKKKQLEKDALWETLDVIISDTNVAGEGDTKIISFIKTYMLGNNKTHAIYTGDTDLAFLALGILGENIVTYLQDRGQVVKPNSEPLYKEYYVKSLREFILKYVLKIDHTHEKINKYRQLFDFMFLAIFWGNDYVPPSRLTQLMELMLKHYKGEWERGEYLTDFTEVDGRNLDKLLKRVATDHLEHGGKFARRARWIDVAVGSENDYMERYVNSILSCLEFNLTGHTNWQWENQVDRPPPSKFTVRYGDERLWRRNNSSNSHELPIDSKAYYAILLSDKSVELQSHLLDDQYRSFRQRGDIKDIYAKAFKVKNDEAAKDDGILRVKFDGAKLLSTMRNEGLANCTEKKYPRFLPGKGKNSFLFKILKPATSDDERKKLLHESYCFEEIPYTREMWEKQLNECL